MRVYWLVGLLGVGCATARQDMANPLGGEMPKTETVYRVPLDEAMMVARRIFEERRYDVFEREKGTELFTSAHEPAIHPPGAATWERYYVKGERLGPRETLVRVFRLRYEELSGAGTKSGAANEEADMVAKAGPRPTSGPSMDRDGVTPNPQGTRYIHSDFTQGPFAGAPQLEGFQVAQGFRDMEVEGVLLTRLERVPALEIVGGAAPAKDRSTVTEVVEEASAPSIEQPAACGEALRGAAPLLTKGGTLLVADPLGTRELPTAALQLLCDASAKGLPVALGLSLPAAEQPLLDEYLASAGQSADQEKLLTRGSFWRRTYQDGRGSRAVTWLIEQARRLRASGRAVSLVALDSDGASGNAREEEMAKHALAFRQKNPDAFLVALSGGVHVRTGGVGWDGSFEPFGARLSKALPGVRSLDVGFTRGTQFACRYNVWEKVECNVFAISPTAETLQPPEVANGVQLFAQPSPEGFHGRLYVGALSASLPALKGAQQNVAEPTASK